MSVRGAERAARAAGARRRTRRPPVSGLDPELVSRATRAAERLTGKPARIAPGRLEVAFEDEQGLAELVEALELATWP